MQTCQESPLKTVRKDTEICCLQCRGIEIIPLCYNNLSKNLF